MKINIFSFRSALILIPSLLLGASSVAAANLDCTNGCDDVASFGAVWSTDEVAPSGTGVLNPFVQLQANGTEQGYNTTVNNVFDNKSSDEFNHELLLSAIPIKSLLGIDYREFILDIGEPQNGTDNYLSLDGLKLFVSDTPNQSTTNVNSLGTLVYNLDASGNNSVLLDSSLIGSGNGNSDLFVYIPNSAFLAALASVTLTNPYVYLWSQFGLLGVVDGRSYCSDKNFGTAGSFEEWAVRTAPATAVPEPATMAFLAAAGLLGAARARKRV